MTMSLESNSSLNSSPVDDLEKISAVTVTGFDESLRSDGFCSCFCGDEEEKGRWKLGYWKRGGVEEWGGGMGWRRESGAGRWRCLEREWERRRTRRQCIYNFKNPKALARGQNAGNFEVLADLTGFGVSIRRNSKGDLVLGGTACQKRTSAKLGCLKPMVGKALLKLPLSFKKLHYLLVGGKPRATAMRLSERGEILEVLEDSEGKSLRFIRGVEENNGKLWVGSVLMPSIGIYNL
ncbi:hypothetical protein RHMOL_Rhmol10G0079000 [Rhododendron molle]|uniref:Uncharacterized protein n=1 Tax=Rhododendron molle TaxID=49168 RepID=A0ACC0M048_RHOML|nr:hypothetical protein RHMOL_Rhmol10G0079000 [Rhododendron molle]